MISAGKKRAIFRRTIMKSCPTCRRIYADDTLRFCLEDGAPLASEVRPGTEKTLALPEATKVLDDPALAPTQPAREEYSVATLRREPAPRAEGRSTTSVVALTVVATVLLLGLGGVIAWQLMKGDEKGGGGGNTNTSIDANVSTPTPTATPTATPPPADGFVEGSMAYPSDAIPGVMVACAENVETGAILCTQRRKDWEAGVRYSLKLPAGRYYVYATLLSGDDSVGDLTGKKAYYTDYMKCGMGANCSSHSRIVLSVGPGETLNGITVGDWWAEL